MRRKMMKIEELLGKLQPNPENPRIIKEDEFERLKVKLKEFPEMLEKRPVVYDENFIILGGNQRFRALRELQSEGFVIKESYFVNATNWTEEQKKQFIITDNVPDGKWDYDLIANEWSDLPLNEWGLNVEGWVKGEIADTEKEWQSMPEFTGESSFEAFKSIMVHFKTEEDYQKFGKLLNETLTEKTKYIWYPHREKEAIKELSFGKEDES